MTRDEFSSYHPIVNFAFFCAAVVFTTVIFHPVTMVISLAASITYAVILRGGRAVKTFFGMPLVVMIVTVLVNGLTVHRGDTILFTIRTEPVTKEALTYGVIAGLMIAAVLMWFYCYGLVMTSDKFMNIFGRAMPRTSLVFSMILRYIPRLNDQEKKIAEARRSVYGADSEKGFIGRLGKSFSILSVLTTWSLENSIDTADSMRARGYGLPCRSTYDKYSFEKRDKVMLVCIIAASMVLIFAEADGLFGFTCYPVVKASSITGSGQVALGAYTLLVFMPSNIWMEERIAWRYLKSKI